MPAVWRTVYAEHVSHARSPIRRSIDRTLAELGVPPWDIVARPRGHRSSGATNSQATAACAGRWSNGEELTMSGVDVVIWRSENVAGGQLPGRARAPTSACSWRRKSIAASSEHAKEDVSVEICGVLVGRWEARRRRPVRRRHRLHPLRERLQQVRRSHVHPRVLGADQPGDGHTIRRRADHRLVPLAPRLRHLPLRPRLLHPAALFLRPRPGGVRDRPGPRHGRRLRLAGRQADAVAPLLDRRFDPHRRSQPAGRRRPAELAQHHPAGAAESAGVGPPSRRQSSLDLTATLLAWIALFLLGYLVSGLQVAWERE